MRPLIGITTSTATRDPRHPRPIASAVNLAYSVSVYQADGMPLLLPNVAEPADADDIVAGLHGLLLSGGGDVDPAHWGEPPHPKLGSIDPRRDALEMALLHAARRRQMPALGICRGGQLMAVALGGDLWQDIPAQLPANVGHFQQVSRPEAYHPVRVAPDSLLARIFAGELRPRVNSFHHQAVRRCGELLTPIAWSDDDLIEAVAAPDAPFLLGVQWHPEEMTETDPPQARLFSTFMQAARDYAARILPA